MTVLDQDTTEDSSDNTVCEWEGPLAKRTRTDDLSEGQVNGCVVS